MKIIVNGKYGGFWLQNEVLENAGYDAFWYDKNIARRNPSIIKWVLEHSNETDLKVVDIPDEATDYDILSEDGLECVLYVLDGKIHYINID